MNKYDYVKEYIENLPSVEFIDLFNKFCKKTGEDDGYIHPMSEFNAKINDLGLTPFEIAEIGGSCIFNCNDNCFIINYWEQFYSADDPLELADDLLESFIEYLAENEIIEIPETIKQEG